MSDFGRTHARNSDPETSKAAAESMSEAAAKQATVIRNVLLEHGRLHAEGIAGHCQLDRVQIGRRMSDLERVGWASRTGEKGKLSTGRSGELWEATAIRRVEG